MTISIMMKKCEKCKKKFPYNPSVGKFGLICPYCGAIQKKL